MTARDLPRFAVQQRARAASAGTSTPGSVLQLQLSRPTTRCVLIQVRGELDAASCPRLQELVASRLSSTAETLVLDLSQLSFIGVAGLELLNHTRQRAASRGIELRLVTGPRCLHRALIAAEMTETWDCYPDLDHALSELTGRARHVAAVG